VWATAVLVVSASACKRGGTITEEDAGLSPRASGTPEFDAGVQVDAGPELDSGVQFDAGVEFDAGTDLDAGVELDAGTEPDAGLVLDAGLIFDAGVVDAGVVDAGVATGPLIYPGNRTHSPIDAALAQNLRLIASRGTGNRAVFAKIGDSISTATSGGAGGGQFLNCFDGTLNGPNSWDITVRLGAYGSLQGTLDFFRQVRFGTDDSWSRPSLATRVGAFANWATAGNPSPMDREIAALNPRYAVVMFGSNDIGAWSLPYPLADQLEQYEGHMRAIATELLAQGVVPLFTTMPPDNDPRWLRFTPAYAGVVRAIAQGRQVPLIDYQRELRALGPPYGLGNDGTHPTCAAWNGCCWLDATSLRHGYNVRNLITLQALDRMVQIFERNVNSIDSQAERLRGDGTPANPFVVNDVPFAELRRLSTSTARGSGTITCGAQTVSVTGPQVTYRLTVPRAMNVRITLLDDGARAHRMSITNGTTCTRTATRLMTLTLPAGTSYLQVNTTNGNTGSTVDYNLSITECMAGDPDC
jgi:hypothetical protein